METINVRASGLWAIFDCPKRWAEIHIFGNTLPSRAPAWIGTSIHASTAAFDDSTLHGKGLTVDDTAGVLVDLIHNPSEEVADFGAQQRKRAEKIGLSLHTRYCHEVAPKGEYAAVELSLPDLPIEFDEHGLTINLTGTLDRLYGSQEKGFGIKDIKSGERAVSADGQARTQGHGIQLGVYELLASQVAPGPITQPAEIIGMQTGGAHAGDIALAPISGARDALLGSAHQHGLLEHAATIISNGLEKGFPGNAHSSLCSDKYCPAYHNCQFKL